MEFMDTVFVIIILVFSIVVHEVMHGVAADWLGDPTARLAGRLTANPIKHIDPLGSIIVPIITSFTGMFFGWAKPVPVNPYNFRRFQEWGEAITAAAGPLSNLVLALIFGLVIRLDIAPALVDISVYIVLINTSLFILNMIPIPPLDGSKILGGILPGALGAGYQRIRDVMEQNFVISLVLLFVFINLLGSAYSTFVVGFARLIAGF
jgi:Zn-dependent protease